MNKFAKVLLGCLIYAAAVATAYFTDSIGMLGLLTVPWSMPAMALSGLIMHATVDGEQILKGWMVIGGVLNILIVVWWNVLRDDSKGSVK